VTGIYQTLLQPSRQVINKDSLRQYSAKEWKWIVRIILREMKCVTEDMTLQVMVSVEGSELRVNPQVLLDWSLWSSSLCPKLKTAIMSERDITSSMSEISILLSKVDEFLLTVLCI
jgi:hypothetical protein